MKTLKMTVSKTFEFDFAHFLPNYLGKCRKLHGHRGRLLIEIEDYVNPETGMVMDFVEINKVIKEEIVNELDHSFLNRIIKKPTAENIVKWIWEKLEFSGFNNLKRIKFWETPSSCCILTKKDMNEYTKQYLYNNYREKSVIEDGSVS